MAVLFGCLTTLLMAAVGTVHHAFAAAAGQTWQVHLQQQSTAGQSTLSMQLYREGFAYREHMAHTGMNSTPRILIKEAKFGFPFRIALYTTTTDTDAHTLDSRGHIHLATIQIQSGHVLNLGSLSSVRMLGSRVPQQIVVPLDIDVAMLLLSTACYAMCYCLISALIPCIRRAHRKLTHAYSPIHPCTVCGYELDGIAAPECPECGQTIA
ncbi:MAG: hypothetical protein ACTS3F_01965 [Phycisphaerales bacterium]